MAWRYSQSTGLIEHSVDGILWQQVWKGYSGCGRGLNDPESQHLDSVGPIPCGKWTIGPPYDSKRVGPFALMLTPHPDTQTFGRADFRIHGDNRHMDKSASRGCIVAPREVREAIHESSDTELIVVSGKAE
jgi:hypothetical protein